MYEEKMFFFKPVFFLYPPGKYIKVHRGFLVLLDKPLKNPDVKSLKKKK